MSMCNTAAELAKDVTQSTKRPSTKPAWERTAELDLQFHQALYGSMGLGQLYIKLLPCSTDDGMLNRQTACFLHYVFLSFGGEGGGEILFSSKYISFPIAFIMPISVILHLLKMILDHI